MKVWSKLTDRPWKESGAWAFTQAKVAHLIELSTRWLGQPSHLKVLDVGCGVGLTERHLVDVFGSVWGVDVSAESVQMAASANPAAHFRSCGTESLPFESGGQCLGRLVDAGDLGTVGGGGH